MSVLREAIPMIKFGIDSLNRFMLRALDRSSDALLVRGVAARRSEGGWW